MSISVEEFYVDFFQEVAGRSEQGQFLETSFTETYCDYLIDAGEFDTFDAQYFKTDRGIRVDGYAGDPLEDDGVLTLIVSDFSTSDTPESLTRTEIEAFFKRLLNFYRFALKDDYYIKLEESSSAYGLARFVNSRKSDIYRLRLFLLSNKQLSRRVEGMPDEIVDGIPVSYNVWDISRLHRLLTSKHGKEDIRINLVEEFGSGLPSLPANVGGQSYESYLTVVPGDLLAQLYGKWGARLLEQNVRCFLQARNKVNKGIRNTILNEPEMFFAFNNGITATAQSVDIVQKDGIEQIVGIDNLQIVNGGQTTASIFTAMKKDKAELSNIFVQMKLSVVNDPEAVVEVVPRISEYANSQNRVNAADFFSNHPFHIRMQDFSRRVLTPSIDGSFLQSKWFYERARGQYMDARAYLTVAERKAFDKANPKAQSFTKTDLAKFENVWEKIPHIVSQGAQKNFAYFAKQVGARWEKDEKQYNELYFKHLVAKAIIFRALEKLVMKQSWYEGGYRANIVAYTISKLSDLVDKTGNSVDFTSIWNRQSISDELQNALLHIAENVYEVLVSPPEGIRNISEWAKKEACWGLVNDLRIGLPTEFKRQLVGDIELQEEEVEARVIQRIDNGIMAQARVIELGAPFWKNVLQWERENMTLSGRKERLIETASMIPHRIPNENQSIALTEILDDLKLEGCPYVQNI